MDESRKSIGGKKAIESFERLRRVLSDVDINDPSPQDKEWIQKSLNILFISKPIDLGDPFSVDNRTDTKPSGSEFDILNSKLVSRDTPIGCHYRIRITATNGEVYYRFEGRILESYPNIEVEKAYIDHSLDTSSL